MFSQAFTSNIKCELKNIFEKNHLQGIVIGIPDNTDNAQPFYNGFIHSLSLEESIYILELLKHHLLSEWNINKYI